MKTIILDMMAADKGAKELSDGVKLFLSRNPGKVRLIAVGKQEELQTLVGITEIIDARDVVPMEAGARDVIRMKDSSMMKAIDLYAEQKADAIISCGGTGAYLSAATLKLKLIEGVERAALIVPMPNAMGRITNVLDIGASNENSPEHLVQFAEMGRLFNTAVYGNKVPKVYMLANGTEDKKGSPASKIALKMLQEQNFPGLMGNIEGREALSGIADVIVTDGFTGNVFLKTTEGVFKIMSEEIKKIFKRNIFSKIGYLFAKKGVAAMKAVWDYRVTGGSMLLGLNGVVVKAHGSSDALAFSYAIEVGLKLADANIVETIRQGIKHETAHSLSEGTQHLPKKS
jgi:glycerol-3-phosphate acyltransferase PlsX